MTVLRYEAYRSTCKLKECVFAHSFLYMYWTKREKLYIIKYKDCIQKTKEIQKENNGARKYGYIGIESLCQN